MRILIVDSDQYAIWYLRHCVRLGNVVEMRTASEAMAGLLVGERWTEAILDVAPQTRESTINFSQMPESLALCDRLARQTETGVTVYTRMSRRDWAKHPMGLHPQLARIGFYSKSNLDIPPLLKGIEGLILGNPLLIGFDIGPLVPKQVARDWIAATDSRLLYALLSEYVRQKVSKAIVDDVRVQLPTGLIMLWQVMRFESEIENGGMVQYFGNQVGGERLEPPEGVVPTIRSLQRMGAAELADLISAGFAVFERLNDTDPDSAEENALIDELETLTNQYYTLDGSYVLPVQEYIEAHPDEFVHLPDQQSES